MAHETLRNECHSIGGALKWKNSVLFLLGAVLAASSAFGGLIVNEPPDFPASNPTSYNLTDGVNVFTGTVSGCPNCGGDFQDRFILVLPPGASS
jgi:hypothetical protein